MKNWLKNNIAKIKDALLKTRKGMQPHVETKKEHIEINNAFYEDLLEKLIKADVGINLSGKIIEGLRKKIKDTKINNQELQIKLKEIIKITVGAGFVGAGFKPAPTGTLNIFLIVGVNGSGKTTTIGKLAKKFKAQGFKVLIVAADTFRAAAGEQLDIWAERAGVKIFAPPEIKKPDAVVFGAIEKAKKENYNLLLIDSAGRLHSQINLMDELKKTDLVIKKNIEGYCNTPLSYEKLIVLDATIGQNAIVQAEMFSKAINLNGVVLAKLDSSSKGGVVLNIMQKFSLPVRFIGTGEKIDDLAEFNLDEYLDGLLGV